MPTRRTAAVSDGFEPRPSRDTTAEVAFLS